MALRIARYQILLVLLFLSGACRTADGPQFDPLLSYKGEETLVFIYRPTPSYYKGGGLAPDIVIDGKKVVDLKSMGYTRLFLKQGAHTLEVKRAHAFKNRRESRYEFVIPPDKRRCFIRVILPNALGQDLTILTINTIFSLSSKLYVPLISETEADSGFVMDFIDEQFALEEIKKCRFISPQTDDEQ